MSESMHSMRMQEVNKVHVAAGLAPFDVPYVAGNVVLKPKDEPATVTSPSPA